MYRVVMWDTDEILDEFEDLDSAKRIARNQGHDSKPFGVWLCPLARVDGPMRHRPDGYGVEYNPSFRVDRDEDFKPVPYVKRMHGLFGGCKICRERRGV